jgi:MFS family permease
MRSVPETSDPAATGRPDLAGAVSATIGLGGLIYALIEAPTNGWDAVTIVGAVAGVVALLAFPIIESRSHQPLLPLEMFRSRQFTGANLTTLGVYAALGGALFLVSLQLQESLGWSALAAGVSTLPLTVIMLLLSSRVGALADRIGPRLLMTVGPLVAGAGLALMARIVPGSGYLDAVFPAVVVFGFGLSLTVAPLTSTVLGSVSEHHAGSAAGVNNAISRTAGLLAVAIIPLVAGVRVGGGGLGPGFSRAMLISAAVCCLGGIVALLTVTKGAAVEPQVLPGVNQACQHPCTRRPPEEVA